MGWGSPEDPTSQAPWEGSPAWSGIMGTQGIGHLWPQRWLHFREEKSHFPSHQCGRSSEYSRVFKGKIGVSGGSDGKESKCQCRRCRFGPWVGKIPWRRERQPTPVFLPGESHEQRRLVRHDLATKQQGAEGSTLQDRVLQHKGPASAWTLPPTGSFSLASKAPRCLADWSPLPWDAEP